MENNHKDKINMHERIKGLEVKVKLILDNHFPHLQKRVDDLNTKFWAIIVLLIANLIAILRERL